MERTPVQVLDRAMEILNYLEKVSEEASLADIRKALNLNKTTTLRILSSLCDNQLVTKNPKTRRYLLGPRLFELGSAVARRWNIRKLAMPFLEQLRDTCRETVGLYIRQGKNRVCIDQYDGLYQVRRTLIVGQIQPLYPGAAGKVFLAYMPREEAKTLLAELHPIQFLRGDWSDLGKALEELDTIVGRGCAVSIQELLHDAVTMAAPVFDHTGNVAAAISIATTISRWSPQREAEMATMLRQVSLAISRASGYRPANTTSTTALA